ncbi:protein shisa-4-like [Saccostrea cucullata]|uniref:protein shisa-4-like n=1 Tax=Saccostrea cuccullata TaxID=36930 RepID=UPI002ED4E37B
MSVIVLAGFFAVLFAFCLQTLESASYCYYRYAYSRYYCYYYYYYDISDDESSLGGLIAGLIVLAIVVGVVVCLIKAKHNRSRVVALSGNTGTSVHVSNVNTVHHAPPPPQYGHMAPQPGYGQPHPGFMQAPNQPMYGGGNPAYPPGHHY